jgi:hypothetical protein
MDHWMRTNEHYSQHDGGLGKSTAFRQEEWCDDDVRAGAHKTNVAVQVNR